MPSFQRGSGDRVEPMHSPVAWNLSGSLLGGVAARDHSARDFSRPRSFESVAGFDRQLPKVTQDTTSGPGGL